ncbi:hypothetical protein NDN08_004396 [Rhodosorus marinus]|uniref:holo-[acyl-carrier-protein] synthase n=1 Tax=Rhodosorus marinus TaxID=101924 RepID=A0AAV8UPQ1_9RHOD|nr:hypothetical protein NDN08_004396 [Rhodosorus marinus]
MKLEPNTVHVWTLLLRKQKTALSELQCVLCASERERLAKFNRQKDQIRFAENRMFLRSTIGRYTGEEPTNVRFSYGHNGKPFLVDHPWLKFNLSHTLDYAAIAVTRDYHVGVDLESVHRKVTNLSRLAARKLTTSEWERIKSCDESTRTAQFLRAWTRKEAFIKATGEGLSRDLKTVEVSLEDSSKSLLVSLDGSRKKANDWRVYSFNPFPAVLGAIAVKNCDVHTVQLMPCAPGTILSE